MLRLWSGWLLMSAARTGRGNTPIRAIRVPEDVWRAAQAEAELRGESVSEAVVRFLKRYGRVNT